MLYSYLFTLYFLYTTVLVASSEQSSSHATTGIDSEENNNTNLTPPYNATESKEQRGVIDNYSPWTRWSRCNRKCEQKRVQRCRLKEVCGKTRLKEKRICKRRRGACSVLSYQVRGFRRRNRYESWSAWSVCSRTCKQRRTRKCSTKNVCRNSYIHKERRCSVAGSRCERLYVFKPVKENENKSSSVDTDHVTTTPSNGDSKTSKHSPKNDKKKKSPRHPIPSLADIQESCGYRPSKLTGSYKVVGGREAIRLSWPWQVAIMTRQEEQYCGGTLIAPQWVLTAAHCIRKNGRRRRVLVRMGEHEFRSYEGTEVTQKPSKDFPHPKFDYTTITNDIGLIRLRKPIHRKSGLGFACLPDENEVVPPKTLCYTVGWGKLKNTHLFGSMILQEAQVPVVDAARCQRVFDYDIIDTQVCAGYIRGGVDSCAGDSGGPLLCAHQVNNTERWFVYGVTSYGEGCGRKGKFGIYTKVPSFVKWIKKVVTSH